MAADKMQPLERAGKPEEVQESLQQIQNAGDLSVRVDDLLGRPFQEALRLLPALRHYIETQEDAKELEEEFRTAWHPEAPAELRQVLEEIIDPGAFAASAAATEEFLKDPTAAFPGEADLSMEKFDETFHLEDLSEADLRGAQQLRGESFEELPEDEEQSVQAYACEQVDKLLHQTFDEAVRDCPALRQYIASQENAREVEEEFRQSWHVDAPEALRQVLEEILDPAAAATNLQETTNFMSYMAASSDNVAPARKTGVGRVPEVMTGGSQALRAKL